MTSSSDEMRTLDGVRIVEYDRAGGISEIERIWCGLQAQCPHDYFLSWGWISTWLESLPKDVDVRLIVGLVQDQPVLAFFVGSARRRKYGLLPTHSLALNTTGNRYFDLLYIEYNSVLALPSLKFSLADLLHWLGNKRWHEFSLPGLSSEFVQQMGLLGSESPTSVGVLLEEESSAYFVDLAKVREAKMDYLGLLSSNKRSQIRRSIKEYEKEGEVHIQAAESVAEALEMLSALAELHQEEWQKRGKPGVFSNPYLMDFHRKLIVSRFEAGEIQILRVFTPQATIGYLYNFVYGDKVLFYQSGLKYRPGNLYRPGLVSHYFSIMQNARTDMRVYDFMAGEAGYKSSLATDSVPMYWVRLVNGRLRFSMERTVLSLKERLKEMPSVADRLKRMRDRFSSAPKTNSA
ncbi:MAG: GNAT family N-acetyltransferase [Chloroflexi bacterium]|nr:GNAT family N-acetyltransferase [Chloroflexota bacterium]